MECLVYGSEVFGGILMGTTCAFGFPKLGAFQSPICPQEIMLFVSCFTFCFCLLLFDFHFLYLFFFLFEFVFLLRFLGPLLLFRCFSANQHHGWVSPFPLLPALWQKCSMLVNFGLTSTQCQELMKVMLWYRYHRSCCLKFVKHVYGGCCCSYYSSVLGFFFSLCSGWVSSLLADMLLFCCLYLKYL